MAGHALALDNHRRLSDTRDVAKRREVTAPETDRSPWPTPINKREIWPIVWSVLLGIVIGAVIVALFV